MSWLFGKKKKDSPTEVPEEVSAATQDDFIMIEKNHNRQDENLAQGSNLYPFLDDKPTGPPIPVPIPKHAIIPDNILGDSQSYLNLIPFKLKKEFECDTEINRIQVDEILSYIIRVTSENYDYDFTLENSVISEMQSTSE
ncbi:uncharacterized protein [Chelonus insularis]|nr:uncharacterized protein LOC118073392 isoform X2 [Chelonus insularis]XP_034949771.1 uncharacterized protein LOC118073392 isoform X2 [Chelonus insularis]